MEGGLSQRNAHDTTNRRDQTSICVIHIDDRDHEVYQKWKRDRQERQGLLIAANWLSNSAAILHRSTLCGLDECLMYDRRRIPDKQQATNLHTYIHAKTLPSQSKTPTTNLPVGARGRTSRVFALSVWPRAAAKHKLPFCGIRRVHSLLLSSSPD